MKKPKKNKRGWEKCCIKHFGPQGQELRTYTCLGPSCKILLWETRGAHSPNLQVAIMHEHNVCTQHSIGLPLRMTGMNRMQSDYMRLDRLSYTIWCAYNLTFYNIKLTQSPALEQELLDLQLILYTLPNLWLHEVKKVGIKSTPILGAF